MNKHEKQEKTNRICQQCGVRLERHRNIADGEIIWTCPGEKCSYKEDEKGEML